MTRRRSDARLAAARYALERSEPEPEPAHDDETDAGRLMPDQRAAAVEIAIQQAMRRGEFEGLPGAGKPIPGLGGRRDPDWWIRRKIEREGLTGLGPPSLTLRAEDEQLDARLDRLFAEAAVREVLEDFNRRVRHARLQLQGGPPVFTRPRDVDAEVEAWRRRAVERREARETARAEERRLASEALAGMTWRERRRARRTRSA